MPKLKKKFTPGPVDFYLAQIAQGEGKPPTRTIVAFKGKKSGLVERFSFTPGTYLAGLHQFDCQTDDEVTEKIKYLAGIWTAAYEWDPAVIALLESAAESKPPVQ